MKVLLSLLALPLTLCGAEIDLRPQWDETIPLANPHKGWYHHLFDNHVKKYLLESDDDLLKFPGMKFVLSHGGAALPYALGRLGRNHQISQGKYADPRKGFEGLYFDSCVFDSDSLEYLAKKASTERIMLGSDMPFPIGDPAPRRVVEGARFTDAQKKCILGGTAQSVFKLRHDCWCPQ